MLNEPLAAGACLCNINLSKAFWKWLGSTPTVSAEALHTIYILLLGFSVAGLLATGYQLVTERPASFNIFGDGTSVAAVAHVPFLVFAGPFIIMRNAIFIRRSGMDNFVTAMVATVTAGCWSAMSGKFVVAAVAMLGLA